MSLSEPHLSVRRRDKRSAAAVAWIGAGVLLAVAAAGGWFLLSKHGTPQLADSNTASSTDRTETSASAVESTAADSARASSAGNPLATPTDPEASAATSADDGVVGIGEPMWAAPVASEPLDTDYIPSGAQLIISLRPAALVASAEGQKLLDPAVIGSAGSALVECMVELTGCPIEEIEHAVWAALPSDAGGVDWVLVVRRTKPSDTTSEDAAESAPQKVTTDAQGLASFQPANEAGQVTIIGTKACVEALASADGQPPILRREIEQLAGECDVSRTFAAIATPRFLRQVASKELGDDGSIAGAADWLLTGYEPRSSAGETGASAGQALRSTDTDARLPKSLGLEIDLTDQLFVELRYVCPSDQSPQTAAWEFRERVGEIAARASDLVKGAQGSTYSGEVLRQLPQMVREFDRFTRVGTYDREIVLRAYLPPAAAHNLALAARLLVVEGGRGTGPIAATASATTAEPESLDDCMARTISLVFERETLEAALALWSDQSGVTADILGADLEAEGITRNQSFGLEVRDKPAAEILTAILARASAEGKLVYVVDTDAERPTIRITTRAAAERRGDVLPKELAGPK